jgi:hypothetical protein
MAKAAAAASHPARTKLALAFTVPPEVIILYGVMKPGFPIHIDQGSLAHFVCLVEQPIAGHNPSDKGPVFLEAQQAVFRTAGIHGTFLTVNWRQVVSMELHQGTKRVKCLGFLPGRGGVGGRFFPWPFERFGIYGIAEPANEKQKGYVQKETSCSHSKMITPGILFTN